MIYLAIVTFYIEKVTLVLAKGQALLFCNVIVMKLSIQYGIRISNIGN